MSPNKVKWRKSTHSGGNGGECVEVARSFQGAVLVRDSKIPCGPVLTFTPEEWRTFLKRIRNHA